MDKLFKLSIMIIVSLALIWGVYTIPHAATQNDFVLSILKDNNPIREFNGEVAIPFGTEYKIRLKNNNHRRCVAIVWIDGAKASEIGDFIIDSTDHLDLERFLDRSLTEGKKFKFVPLSHPDVDDPSRAENGIVKVEFRLERQYIVWTRPEPQYPFIEPEFEWYKNFKWGQEWGQDDFAYHQWEMDRWVSTDILISTKGNVGIGGAPAAQLHIFGDIISSTNCSNAGATIPGSQSNQTFFKIDFTAEDEVVIIRLKLVGI